MLLLLAQERDWEKKGLGGCKGYRKDHFTLWEGTDLLNTLTLFKYNFSLQKNLFL